MITQSEIKNRLHYDPQTGVFTWLKNNEWPDATNAQYAGQNAGHLRVDLYVIITIQGVNYQAHRLAWIYIYGEQPDIIDHLNGVRFDNRIVNLANVNKQRNSKNLSLTSKNKYGCFGISEVSVRVKKFKATIKIDGVLRTLGIFDDVKDAIKARKDAERAHQFHENHGKQPAKNEPQKQIQRRPAKRIII